MGWALTQYDCCPFEKGSDTETGTGRMPGDGGGRHRSDASTTQGTLRVGAAQEAERKARNRSRCFKREHGPADKLSSNFQPSEL